MTRASTPAEPDDGDDAGQRRCIASGATGDKVALVRFVVGPEGSVVPDVDGRLPGRGLWVGARRELVDEAVKKRLFSKAARAAVEAPEDLANRVEALLARRAREQLGLARRAGLAVAGFDKVAEYVASGEAGLLLTAAEAAPNGREKMSRLAGDLPRVEVLTNEELSLALGRENVVHAAVARGTFADRLSAEALRLAGFRRAAAEHARVDATE